MIWIARAEEDSYFALRVAASKTSCCRLSSSQVVADYLTATGSLTLHRVLILVLI